MSQEDLTFAAPAQFEGTYGSHRNKEYVKQKLKEVAAILDDLAVHEGVACVMVNAADFEQNNDGIYVPLMPESDEDTEFFKNVITPIIEKRLELRQKWFDKQDARMGFTLSA